MQLMPERSAFHFKDSNDELGYQKAFIWYHDSRCRSEADNISLAQYMWVYIEFSVSSKRTWHGNSFTLSPSSEKIVPNCICDWVRDNC